MATDTEITDLNPDGHAAFAPHPEARGPALRAMAHVSRFIGHAIAPLYLICAGITVFEVVMRYAFHAPTQWAFEMVMTLCALAWVLSAGYITLYRRHIAITVITDMAGPGVRRRLAIVSTVVSLFAIYVLLESSMDPMLKAIDLVQRTGSGFNSPMPTFLKAGLVAGTLLYAAQLVANLYEDVAGRLWRVLIGVLGALLLLRLGALVVEHYFGATALSEAVWGLFAPLDPIGGLGRAMDIRSVPIGWVTLGLVMALLALMLTGMPLGVATLTVSILCAILFFGPRGLFLVSSNVLGLLEHYTLVAVPLFVLMSCILERSGVAKDLFDAMSIFAGNLRGGVAVQTTVVAVVLAAMTGIMGGEIVMLGLVALPQMLRLGYDRKLAMGVICAAGSLATLIPPSIIMIVYGLAAQVGIGELFMAGALPGALYAGLYILYILVICRLRPHMAPTASEIAARQGGQEVTMARHRLAAVLMALAVIGMVMGSIYAGIASVTEAAGVGVLGACIVAAIRRQLSLGHDAGRALAHHHHGGHDHLAGAGGGEPGGHLQRDRRRRLHARDVHRPRRAAAGRGAADDGGADGAGHLHGVDRHRLHHGADLRAGGDGAGAGPRAGARSGGAVVRGAVRDEHADLLPVAALRAGVLLAQERRPAGDRAAGDLRRHAALHRAAGDRAGAGDRVPADRAVPARAVVLGARHDPRRAREDRSELSPLELDRGLRLWRAGVLGDVRAVLAHRRLSPPPP